jgi:ankyrin repeat protein
MKSENVFIIALDNLEKRYFCLEASDLYPGAIVHGRNNLERDIMHRFYQQYVKENCYNINTKNSQGNTLLHLALYVRSCTSTISELLSVGADPGQLNHALKSPLDLARNLGVNTEVFSMLQNARDEHIRVENKYKFTRSQALQWVATGKGEIILDERRDFRKSIYSNF